MTNPVGGPRPGQTNFDEIQHRMENTADGLKNAASDQTRAAGRNVAHAGERSRDVAMELSGAASEALLSTSKTLEGIGHTAESAGHAAAAGAMATAGGVGWVVEKMLEGARSICKNIAKGFAFIANAFTRLIKDGKFISVEQMKGDPTAVRFSERMFGKAAEQLEKSGESMNMAWKAYAEAIKHSSASGEHLGMAAAHTAAVAVNLVEAAGRTGAAGVIKVAELGVRVSALAVEAAEQGVKGARDLSILSAKFSGKVANLLAQPDQGKIDVQVNACLKAYEKELGDLMKKEQGVRDMPTAQEIHVDVKQSLTAQQAQR